MNKNRKHRKATNRKRLIAGVATATALSAAMAVTAIAAPMDGGQGFAEQNQQPQFSQEMQAPEGAGQFGEGEFDQQGTAPKMENGQLPGDPGMGGHGSEMMGFDQFAEQGIISQETLDAIHAYMSEHAPEGMPEFNGEKPEGMPEFNGERSEGMPEFNGEKPEGMPEFNGEKPEGMPEFNGERPEGMPEFNGERPEDAPDLLGDLLAESIITQEEYDALSEVMPQPGPAPFGNFGGPKPAGEFGGSAPEVQQDIEQNV